MNLPVGIHVQDRMDVDDVGDQKPDRDRKDPDLERDLARCRPCHAAHDDRTENDADHNLAQPVKAESQGGRRVEEEEDRAETRAKRDGPPATQKNENTDRGQNCAEEDRHAEKTAGSGLPAGQVGAFHAAGEFPLGQKLFTRFG